MGESFTDVPKTSGYYRFVETLLHKGVAGRLHGDELLPGAARRRAGQMAVFALVGKEGSSYSPPACGATPMFADVPVTSPYCKWVEELARRGIAGGCGGGNYCPGSRRDARADADLHAEDARSGVRPAGLHDADVRGRAGVEPVLQVDRGAGAARCRRRLRWRQLLPGESGDARADGRLHQRDLRPDALRAVS